MGKLGPKYKGTGAVVFRQERKMCWQQKGTGAVLFREARKFFNTQ